MFTGGRSRHQRYLNPERLSADVQQLSACVVLYMLTEHYPDNDRDYTTHLFITAHTHENTTCLPDIYKELAQPSDIITISVKPY